MLWQVRAIMPTSAKRGKIEIMMMMKEKKSKK